MDRRVKWQLKKSKLGLCIMCGRKKDKDSKSRCRRCLDNHILSNRKYSLSSQILKSNKIMNILKKLFCKHQYEEWGTEVETYWDEGQEKSDGEKVAYRVFKCKICGKEKRY